MIVPGGWTNIWRRLANVRGIRSSVPRMTARCVHLELRNSAWLYELMTGERDYLKSFLSCGLS